MMQPAHQQVDHRQTKQILWAMILGLIVGLVAYYYHWTEFVSVLEPLGTMFIKLLKMLIVPLVLSSIYMSIVNLGSPEKLGSLGVKSIIYYFITTCIAVLIGLILVNIFKPGSGLDIASISNELSTEQVTKFQTSADTGLFKTIMSVLMDAVPANPFQSMAEMQILQIIVFSIFLGIASLVYRDDAKPMIGFMESLEKLSMTLIHWIMKIAPIGIFALMVAVISTAGLHALEALGKYMVVVVLGLTLHFFVLLAIASWRHKSSPWFVVKSVLPAMLTAFSTSSSASTLPVTMACVEDNLGVDRNTAQFVLPLGATINMDGTALYESVAVIFIGQAYGLDLSLGNQIIIFMTASLAAVGAAAIPGAGLVTMSIVLSAVGYPLDGIGLILAVDRLLDMFRTCVNVFGDAVGTVVVESYNSKTSPQQTS
ncbi:MAG: dicarboxylate/amino acid:cation symporter [Halobacteriovoraceae bacterium]|nr:dicarboxylate/amino acid:cation symporter [Halobacteriovoraceae bacterium]